MPYLNVDEVESALTVATSAPYDTFTQLIPLPHLTWDGRQCHAVRIGKGSDPGRPGVFLLGGLHAREWGSADILVNFVEQVEQAYLAGSGITLGLKTFSAADIKTIVENLDIIVFPQANPDGRHHSMTAEALWRKNRRTAAPNSGSGSCVGVDLNRNFDFLWDFQARFAPTSTVSCSDQPCDHDLYHGPGPFSEPETLNVQWIHDQFPNVGFFVDLHSHGQTILYSWGDDDNQEADPGMTFQNPAYDGVRGILDALGQPGHEAYREYVPPGELAPRIALANAFAAGIQAVRGTSYAVEQSVGLYPTAGASDDYAYARHFVDGARRNVMSYTLEWGAEFQPPYAEMQNITPEITAGLLAFCLRVRTSIERCLVTTDRATFGKDEIDAMLLTSSPARVGAAFYVVVDGFRHEELGVTAATLAGTPDVKPTVTFDPPLGKVTPVATACGAEGNTLVDGPQRFTWTFALQFDDSTDFTQEILPVTMTVSLTTGGGVTVSAQALLTLTRQPNPYEIDGPASWLSVDLQVFNLLENGSLPGTPTTVLDAGPRDFIQRLLTRYNDPALPRAPNHPFDLDLVAHQDASSVEIAGSIGGTPVYDFAVARVRYRALSTPVSNVRVFFRLFQAPTTSTEFQPSTTYLTGGQGGTRIPLLGVVSGEVVTIPCFAADRVDPTNPLGLNAQTDPLNVGPLGQPIPPDASGAEVQAYFGCWLDINQDVPVLPAPPASPAGPFAPVLSVQQAIKNKHQCLVAQIDLDPPAPQIAAGASPAVSDKLAQRNLNIVGVASPHLVPNVFEVRATAEGLPPDQLPDELMLDWRDLPAGSEATVYFPGVRAQELLATADRHYTHHGLSKVDDHTLGCKAAGVTYIPIPPGRGASHAGLLTVKVPSDVRKGHVHRVVARQLTQAVAVAPERLVAPTLAPARLASTAGGVVRWRKVLGSFQVDIPVTSREALLGGEQRLLSVLRWIAETLPDGSRWHAVFDRYLDQTATRLRDLGGDPGIVAPSSSGDWHAGIRCRRWGRTAAVFLVALLASLGALTGPALVTVPPVIAVGWIAVSAAWIRRCNPGPSRWLRVVTLGVGLAAALLACLLVIGATAPQLPYVLCFLAVVLVVTLLSRNEALR